MLATLIPQGIVCVESALFHYGYSDFARVNGPLLYPLRIQSKLDVDALPVQPYFVQQDLYELGKLPGTHVTLLSMTESARFVIASNTVPAGYGTVFKALNAYERSK